MHPLLALSTALALALALPGCGAGPTGPAPGAPELTLERAEVTLLHLGETAPVTARSGGRATGTPALSLAEEARWLNEISVLDSAALAAGTVRAHAPGSATVRVEAFGASATLRVHVRPGSPLVLSVAAGPVGDGDTLRIRGYRLGEVAGPVTVGGSPAAVVGRDSATLHATLPSLPAAGCVSGAARGELRVAGAEVPPGTVVTRRRRGELDLRVGEAAPVGAGCLRLAAHPGARYALAFLDARAVEAARHGYEGAAPGSGTYVVSVAEGRSAAPEAAARMSVSAAPAAHREVAATGPGAPTTRSTPWREGETFAVRDPALPGVVRARVARVYGGHLVLAVAEQDDPPGEAWLARADTAFSRMVADGYPVLRGALTPTLPVTSTGSGQLLVLAARGVGPGPGTSAAASGGGRRLSYVLLNTAFEAPVAGILRTLAHELAHAWQEEYARETGAGGAPLPALAAPWAAEGSADLLAWTVVARARGMDPMGNRAWVDHLADPGLAPYALLAANSRGDFTRGYDSGASFLLDAAARLVRKGVPADEALATVARGALDGWHGYDGHGVRRPGMARRMRRTLGAGWDPAEALLTWTLSQAVDDLTDSPELQNHAFRAVSTAGKTRSVGWIAPAVLRSGGRATTEDRTAPVTVSGNAATGAWRAGSPNYLLIEDEGYGGAYTLSASAGGSPLAAVRWMVVRYR